MTGADLSRLSAVDAATALRSFPRRYRDLLHSAATSQGVDADDLANRTSHTGTSAMQQLVDTVSTLTLLEQALSQVLRTPDPALHPGVLDPTSRQWSPPLGLSLDTVLEMLDDQCVDFADMIDGVHSPDWQRAGHIADADSQLRAIDLVHEAVRVGTGNLRAMEAGLASLD
jgi:hypothetical protein